MVIVDGAAANPDRADDLSTGVLQWHAAGKGDQAPVGDLDVVERAARLGQFADLSGVHIEEPSGPGLLGGDVNASQPGSVANYGVG